MVLTSHIVQVLCRMLLRWDLSDVFLTIRLELRVLGEEDHKLKVFFSSRRVDGTYWQCDLSQFVMSPVT